MFIVQMQICACLASVVAKPTVQYSANLEITQFNLIFLLLNINLNFVSNKLS